MTKETSKTIAALGGDILQGGKYTHKDVLRLAGSVVSQREADEGAVKAWGLDLGEDGILECAWRSRRGAARSRSAWGDAKVIRVEIRRAEKRKRKG